MGVGARVHAGSRSPALTTPRALLQEALMAWDNYTPAQQRELFVAVAAAVDKHAWQHLDRYVRVAMML